MLAENPFDVAASGEVVYDMLGRDYHASKPISRSGLWKLHTTSPYEFQWEREHGAETTDPMRLGTAIDIGLFTPGDWATHVLTQKRRTAADHETIEADGGVLLAPGGYARAEMSVEYLRSIKGVRRLLKTGSAQASLFWKDAETGEECKARPDWLDHENPRCPRAVDLKTTADLSDWALERAVKSYGIAMQAWMFLDAAQECGIPIRETWVLWLRTTGAPLARLTRITEPMLESGRDAFRAAIRTYAECKAKGQWPKPNFQPEEFPRWSTDL